MKRSRLAVIAAIVMLTIGFASVTTTLVINGVVGLGESEDFKVVFTSAKVDGRKRNDFIDETKKNINYSTKVLKSIDDESVLDYEVTNTSRNYDADVSITCTAEDNDYVDISYEPKKMVVKAGESKDGSITVKLIKIATKDEEINLTCTLVATPVERESLGEEYILDKGLMIPTNYLSDQSHNEGYFWDYRKSITNVVFEDKTNDRSTAAYTFDVSQNQDKSVMTYLVENEDDNSKYTLYFQSEDKVILNPLSNNFFDEFSLLENIEGLERVDTSNVKNMAAFFWGCSSLKSLDLSSFDTENVETMQSMFTGCSSITELDLRNFKTNNVTTMKYMFANCTNLTSLKIDNFDTNNVTNMLGMFQNCKNLTNLDLSNFNTSNVNRMDYMFNECSSLNSLDLSNFNTSNVTNMESMFSNCNSLTIINLNGFNTSNVTNMNFMFGITIASYSNKGSKLEEIKGIERFDTSNVTNMASMFQNLDNIASLNLSSFNTSNVTKMNCMFINCKKLINLDISNFDFGSIESASLMFDSMTNDAEVIVKDEVTQNRVLNDLPSSDGSRVRPSSWTTSNVIVKNY